MDSPSPWDLLIEGRKKKRKGLKRSWIRSKKKPERTVKKDGRIVLCGEAKRELRKAKHDAAGGRCEIEWGGRRRNRFAPLEGHPMSIGNLCHWPPKGMGNAHGSDEVTKTLWGCQRCHDRLDNRNQKVCPPKSLSGRTEDSTTVTS